MESIASTIRRLVPELPEEELASLVTYLESEGYEHGKDLGYLEADDLKPHLKMFYVRKLLRGLKANAIDEPSSSVGASAVQAGESASAGTRVIAAATSTSNRWVQDFQVTWAELPRDLIKDCEEQRRPSSQSRRKLVKMLGTSMAKHDESPGMAAVKHVARLITSKYPQSFADLTSAGVVIGDGAASFSRQLATYLENKRRPNRNAKRTANDLLEEGDSLQTKRFKGPMDSYGCVAWQPDCDPETWESLVEKRSLLLESSPSSKTDLSVLMAETYPLQRKDINEQKLTVQNLRELWPSLLEETHFFNHVDTLVGFSFRQIFVQELTQKGSKVVDHMLKLSKNAMRALLQRVTSAVDKEGQPVPRHYFALELLCAFFGEDYTQVASFHPHAAEGTLQGLPLTPHLAVIGSSMGDIHSIVLAVDGEECITTTSMEKAMGLLLGAFFVLNISYPPGCPLTMEFLQR
ncbi:unnamed protein product [Ixodes pacificus]